MDRPRVVITGLGTINPVANTVEGYWQGLIEGRSGIDRISHFDASEFPCQIAGEVKDFDPYEYLDHKTAHSILPQSFFLAIFASSTRSFLPIPFPLSFFRTNKSSRYKVGFPKKVEKVKKYNANPAI